MDQSPACDAVPAVNANTAPADPADFDPPATAAGSPGTDTASNDTRLDTGLFTDFNGVCT
ncbi:hypothetical protein ACFO1B_02795 [Dactylosporangium siamense]